MLSGKLVCWEMIPELQTRVAELELVFERQAPPRRLYRARASCALGDEAGSSTMGTGSEQSSMWASILRRVGTSAEHNFRPRLGQAISVSSRRCDR